MVKSGRETGHFSRTRWLINATESRIAQLTLAVFVTLNSGTELISNLISDDRKCDNLFGLM